MTKGESGVFIRESVARIPGLKSETWGTLRLFPTLLVGALFSSLTPTSSLLGILDGRPALRSRGFFGTVEAVPFGLS
jgi:hypothetical protein